MASVSLQPAERLAPVRPTRQVWHIRHVLSACAVTLFGLSLAANLQPDALPAGGAWQVMLLNHALAIFVPAYLALCAGALAAGAGSARG